MWKTSITKAQSALVAKDKTNHSKAQISQIKFSRHSLDNNLLNFNKDNRPSDKELQCSQIKTNALNKRLKGRVDRCKVNKDRTDHSQMDRIKDRIKHALNNSNARFSKGNFKDQTSLAFHIGKDFRLGIKLSHHNNRGSLNKGLIRADLPRMDNKIRIKVCLTSRAVHPTNKDLIRLRPTNKAALKDHANKINRKGLIRACRINKLTPKDLTSKELIFQSNNPIKEA